MERITVSHSPVMALSNTLYWSPSWGLRCVPEPKSIVQVIGVMLQGDHAEIHNKGQCIAYWADGLSNRSQTGFNLLCQCHVARLISLQHWIKHQGKIFTIRWHDSHFHTDDFYIYAAVAHASGHEKHHVSTRLTHWIKVLFCLVVLLFCKVVRYKIK